MQDSEAVLVQVVKAAAAGACATPASAPADLSLIEVILLLLRRAAKSVDGVDGGTRQLHREPEVALQPVEVTAAAGVRTVAAAFSFYACFFRPTPE